MYTRLYARSILDLYFIPSYREPIYSLKYKSLSLLLSVKIIFINENGRNIIVKQNEKNPTTRPIKSPLNNDNFENKLIYPYITKSIYASSPKSIMKLKNNFL